jgi:hypothetical protein
LYTDVEQKSTFKPILYGRSDQNEQIAILSNGVDLELMEQLALAS